MPNTSDAGNVASNGSVTRLNPRQIGIMQFQLPNGQRIAIEDATDEQFDVFRLSIGLRVKEPRPDMWTLFDNRCKAIRHALKYGLVQSGNDPQANEKRSEIVPEKEQKTLAEPTEKRPESIGDESDSGTKTIPGSHAQSAPVAEAHGPDAPTKIIVSDARQNDCENEK